MRSSTKMWKEIKDFCSFPHIRDVSRVFLWSQKLRLSDLMSPSFFLSHKARKDSEMRRTLYMHISIVPVHDSKPAGNKLEQLDVNGRTETIWMFVSLLVFATDCTGIS